MGQEEDVGESHHLTDNSSSNHQENAEMPASAVGNNRSEGVLSASLSWLLSFSTIFCVGLMTGSAAGLLLGETAVALLQSLELLADDKPLMDHLENLITTAKEYDRYMCEKLSIRNRSDNDHMSNIYVSALAVEFGGFCLTLSAGAGLAIGLKMYNAVIGSYSETAMGKAIALAGPLCLMVITAVGFVLGHSFRAFLSVNYTVVICLYAAFFFPHATLLPLPNELRGRRTFLWVFTICLLSPLNTPLTLCIMLLVSFASQTKILLCLGTFFKITPLFAFKNLFGHKIAIFPMLLMFAVTDVFNFAGKPIVSLQSPTNMSSAVVEGVFVGILNCQIVMVAVGMSILFKYQQSGAGRIGIAAVASGQAILKVIEPAIPTLGPGPCIGALMGTAGAVGVAVAAAVITANRYGCVLGHWHFQISGLFGVTVGTGVGAFLTSCTHGGLSPIFVGLCALMIPAGFFLEVMIISIRKDGGWPKFKVCLLTLIATLCPVWLYFTVTIQGILVSAAYIGFGGLVGSVMAVVHFKFVKVQEESPPESQTSELDELLQNLFSRPFSMNKVENLYNQTGSELALVAERLILRLRRRPSDI